jgi:hypothetical protein
MTSLRKSDAQLDAEASQPLEERDLDAAIEVHRALYAADLNWLLRLHVRDGESGIGPPFSHYFEDFLDGRLGAFPWSRAMLALRQNCRSSHAPKHTDRDEWRGSLCHTLTGMVIRLDYSLDAARFRLGLPEEGKTRRTLDNALLFLERRLEDAYWREQQQRPVERKPAEWMAREHVHVGLPGLHREDCRNPVCRRLAA